MATLPKQTFLQEWNEKLRKNYLFNFPESASNINEKKFLSDAAKHIASSEDCQDLSWAAGHHILSLCYHFLRQSESCDIRNELCSLLDACIAACSDVDVQDRARMYLSLLQTLSTKKLKEVLHVPGPGLGSLISDEAELRLASLVKHLKEPILTLSKQCRVSTVTGDASHHDVDFSFPDDVMKMYNDHLSLLSTTALNVRCIIRRTKDCSADIQALVLYFSVPNSWGTVEDVLVGHLSKEANGDTEVTIRCFPQKPFPVKMGVSAEFSVENVFHTCPLSPLDILLDDFFQPLPVPDNYMSCKSNWQVAVFKELWEALGKKGYIAPYLDKKPSNLQHTLEEYVIHSSDGAKDVWAMLFLLPKNHLLLKIKLNEETAFVEIRTDVALLLAYFNDYLKNR